MYARLFLVCAVTAASLTAHDAVAQTAPRGQAASPGQSRANNQLPQPPSGGRPTGSPALGPQTDAERAAEDQARKATQICKGC